MKEILFILFVMGLCLYAGETKIQFSPFKISIQRPYEIGGVIFLILAFVCIRISCYEKGYKACIKDTKEYLEKN